MSLSEIQQEIVDTTGNMIVSASAGTGKTHTMVATFFACSSVKKENTVLLTKLFYQK